MKATINASLEWTADGYENKNVALEGNLMLLMELIAVSIVDLEERLPEDRRAQFRADMLEIINEVIKERSHVHT